MAYNTNNQTVKAMQQSALGLINDLMSCETLIQKLGNIKLTDIDYAQKLIAANDQKIEIVELSKIIAEKKRLDESDEYAAALSVSKMAYFSEIAENSNLRKDMPEEIIKLVNLLTELIAGNKWFDTNDECVLKLSGSDVDLVEGFYNSMNPQNKAQYSKIMVLAETILQKQPCTYFLAERIVGKRYLDPNLIIYSFALKIVTLEYLNDTNIQADFIAHKIDLALKMDSKLSMPSIDIKDECSKCTENLFKILQILNKYKRTRNVEIVEMFLCECWSSLNYKQYISYSKKKADFEKNNGMKSRFTDYFLGCSIDRILPKIIPQDIDVALAVEPKGHSSIDSHSFKKAVIEFCADHGLNNIKELYMPQNYDITDEIVMRLNSSIEPFDKFDGKKVNRNRLLAALVNSPVIESIYKTETDDEGNETQTDIADSSESFESILMYKESVKTKLLELRSKIENSQTSQRYYDQCMTYLITNILNATNETALIAFKEVGWYGKDDNELDTELRDLSNKDELNYSIAGEILLGSKDNMTGYHDALKSLLPEIEQFRKEEKQRRIKQTL